MIFLDANIFLRYLTQSADPEVQRMGRVAKDLIDSVDRGEENATTSEVALHEVAYILASKAHYCLPVPDIVAFLRVILQMPGLKLPRGDKKLYLRALDIYSANPKLEFSDSIIAARVERLGVPLATFDEALAKLPFITRWQPDGP
jgi:predicted nucleic acid-binding protein